MTHKRSSGWGVLTFIHPLEMMSCLHLGFQGYFTNTCSRISSLISTLLLPNTQAPPSLFLALPLGLGPLRQPLYSWSTDNTHCTLPTAGRISWHGFLARASLLSPLWGPGPFGVKSCSLLPHCTSSKLASCTGFFIPRLFIIMNNVEDDFLNCYIIGCICLVSFNLKSIFK